MVIYSDNKVMLRVEPVQTPTQIVPFIHCEVLEYSKQVKETFINVVSTLGRIYALADNPKLLKFSKLVQGKEISKTPRGVIVRFN